MCGATTSTPLRGVVGSSMSSDSSEPESSVAEFDPRHEGEAGEACIREGGSIVGMLILSGKRDERVLFNASFLPMRDPGFKCVKGVFATAGVPVASESGKGGCLGETRLGLAQGVAEVAARVAVAIVVRRDGGQGWDTLCAPVGIIYTVERRLASGPLASTS